MPRTRWVSASDDLRLAFVVGLVAVFVAASLVVADVLVGGSPSGWRVALGHLWVVGDSLGTVRLPDEGKRWTNGLDDEADAPLLSLVRELGVRSSDRFADVIVEIVEPEGVVGLSPGSVGTSVLAGRVSHPRASWLLSREGTRRASGPDDRKVRPGPPKSHRR